MSAQDELPPNWQVEHIGVRPVHGWRVFDGSNRCTTGFKSRGDAVAHAWIAHGRTQAEDTTMRAAVERCAELETALARVTVELDDARQCAAEIRDSLHDAQPSIDEAPSEWMPLTWERATPTEDE